MGERLAGVAPLVEILTFEGCPNREPAIVLVEQIAAELGLRPEVRVIDIPDDATARRLRFRGSPTVLVGGRDIDPTTEQRDTYALSCRVFKTERGIAGQPDARWVREALLGEMAKTHPRGRTRAD